MQTCTLAVDIGASSGRHIAGTVQNGKITLQEVYRFENGVHRENGHLCWDIDTLAKEVVNGLKAAHDAGFAPATIGIDTWAVDFVLLDADNKRIGDAVAYRDERTEGIREALEKEYGLTFADHYARTGIQYQPFNTVYQLMALKKEHPEQLAAAKEQAQGLLDQWKAGDATADSFAALAKENSADETTKENGGLHEDANRDSLDAALTDWLFAQGRQVGGTTVVESTDSSGNVTGYQVLYVESFGEIQWKYQAASSLRSEDYNQWYEDLQAKYPAELTEEGKAIPTL